MRNFNSIDLTGKTYGRLTALSRTGTSLDRRTLWLCRCACGNETEVTGKDLRTGHTQSCGCILVETVVRRGGAHGKSGTRLYRIWSQMFIRCGKPPTYTHVRVLYRDWEDFLMFEAWALNNGYRDDLTLDRKDTLGGYEPANCRWATRKEQGENRYNRVGGYTPVP
jgi:hypothetical protein